MNCCKFGYCWQPWMGIGTSCRKGSNPPPPPPPPPVNITADFTFCGSFVTNNTGCGTSGEGLPIYPAGETIDFLSQVTGPVQSYLWTFQSSDTAQYPNPADSTSANPVVNQAQPGDTVTLVVTLTAYAGLNQAGASVSVTHNVILAGAA